MSSAWWVVLAFNLSMGQNVAADSPFKTMRAALEESRIERYLRDTVISADFQETPFRLAVHQFAEELGLSVHFDDQLADESAVDRPITLRLENISAMSSFNVLLHQARCTGVIEGEQLVVKAEPRARNQQIWRIYPVDDLLFGEADYVDQRSGEKLRWIIIATLAPKEWEEVGGAGRIIRDRENQVLSVFQAREIQEDIRELLDALRYAQVNEGNASVGTTLDSVLKIR
jgi:hypothetical protein